MEERVAYASGKGDGDWIGCDWFIDRSKQPHPESVECRSASTSTVEWWEMTLYNVDKMQAYEKQLLLVLKNAMENSPYLNVVQKTCLERKLQEVVDVWTNPDFVNESEGAK